jgi:UDP-2,3-diacylglucosamine pyrophosphatase LpxH
MAQDRKETFSQLSGLWKDENTTILPTSNKKYVILSDLHFGDGGPADDFRHNKETMKRMLTHYNEKDYAIILLGDIEELWQFDLGQVKKKYDKEIYSLFRKFEDGQIIRVFGNHDREWESPPDPVMKNPEKTKGAPEALKIKTGDDEPIILLVHGHQGNIESDKNSWSSRFFVRLYKLVEPCLKKCKIGTHPLQ